MIRAIQEPAEHCRHQRAFNPTVNFPQWQTRCNAGFQLPNTRGP